MSAPDTHFLRQCRESLQAAEPICASGRVRSFVGAVIEGVGLSAPIGSVCRIEGEGAAEGVLAEIVGFRESHSLLMPLQSGGEVAPGARIRLERRDATVPVGDACLGRVLNGLAEPIDAGEALRPSSQRRLYSRPSAPLSRSPIEHPMDLGVRSLNSLLTVGRGMRMGIFAGSGVGKSTLLGQIARFTEAEVAVIGLVGERGREVREFLERDLGEGLARSVVVVATSDEAPLMRVRAAHTATALAEHFRDEGRQVLLLMDSLTRFCMASREIGLAAGEPPTSRGYTPSVWSALPRLVERAGTSPSGGSITGIYTVLVEGDDPNEPVADAARSVLDGHISLSREHAERGHFPPVDVLASVSRVMNSVTTPEHQALARKARELLAAYRGAEDLISIGAYAAGSDPAVDEARARMGALRALLAQAPEERANFAGSLAALASALGEASP